MSDKKCAFIPFVVAGDPSIEVTELCVAALAEEGADILELGVPFTDAMADGPVIQTASERAAKAGVSLSDVLKLAGRIKDRHPKLKIVIFSYYNPIFKMGISHFAEEAVRAGVTAALTVDLPPEESDGYRKLLAQAGLGTVFLASPTTETSRLSRINDASTEFVYYVSRAGVTGMQSQISATLQNELEEIRQFIHKPIVVGFGISNGDQAGSIASLCDGVVVGSAFVKIISEDSSILEKTQKLRELAREIKKSLM